MVMEISGSRLCDLQRIENKDFENKDFENKDFENKDLKQIFEFMWTKQSELKRTIANNLKEMGMQVEENIGYVYAKGNLPVLLVAHLDTYSNQVPIFLCRDFSDRLYARGEPMGADDRCGVYAIFKILEEMNPHVLFTVGEELGELGAVMATKKLEAPNVKYIIELDRAGYNECVFYNCGNQQFREYIESFGFTTEKGTASDISVLGPAWDIATANLSIGYYNAHMVEEYINYIELKHSIAKVKIILDDCEKVPYFNYQNNFESTRTSEYINWDVERLEQLLEGYTMMTDCGYAWHKPKQKKQQ